MAPWLGGCWTSRRLQLIGIGFLGEVIKGIVLGGDSGLLP